ncbi:MAG: FAD-dependent oxidoreductase [Candidatus Aenigmarchaeota archaeon]|nr:FAD-dependent oxidoreductase [Candidatus Aenigmarchaeota archaeon]
MTYDMIIVGGGPAGLTAAIYATRNNLRTLVLSRDKGKLALAHSVENYPGFKALSGVELIAKLEAQARLFGTEIVEEEATEIKLDGDKFKVQTKENVYTGGAIVLGMGTERARLNIKNEEEFVGKGISYCATCDARFFKDKIVGVVGGSNSAAMSALLLARHAKKVYVIYRKEELRAENIIVDKLRGMGVEIINNTIVKKAEGKNILERIIIEKSGEEEKALELNGLFIEIGYVPATTLADKIGVKFDKNFIKVNEKMETNVKGVYAAGDITTGSNKVMQIATACSEGTIASLSAYKFLKNK